MTKRWYPPRLPLAMVAGTNAYPYGCTVYPDGKVVVRKPGRDEPAETPKEETPDA